MHFDLKERLGTARGGHEPRTRSIFHEPVRPGDVITHRAGAAQSVSEAKTTKLGTGRFWVIDVEYRNQRRRAGAASSPITGFGYNR